MTRTRRLIVAAVCAAALVGGWLAGRDVGPSVKPVATNAAAAAPPGDVLRREPRTRDATDESPAESAEKPAVPAKPPGRVFVHVVASEDDSPISGAKLRAIGVDGEWTTDANGDARVGVPMDDETPDKADTWIVVTAPSRVEGSVHAEVASDGEQRVTERLRPGFAVEGFVHDAAGRPIAGASISAMEGGYCMRPLPKVGEAEADAHGLFRMDGLPLTSWVEFEIGAPGHARRTLSRRPHDTSPLDATLDAAGTIRGVVRTPDGTPAGGARVIAAAVADDDIHRAEDVETYADENGAFVIDILDLAWSWTLVAVDSDFMESEESPEIPLSAGHVAATQDLALRPAATLVIDLDFAVPHAPSVAHLTLAYEPDLDCPVPGRTTVVVTREGKWQLVGDVPGLCRARSEVKLGPGETTTATLRFDEGASLAGVVVDDLGAPVGGAIVKAGVQEPTARTSASAGDGAFLLKGLEVDEHFVSVSAAGHGDVTADHVVAPGDGLRLVVPRNGVVVARLRVPDGATPPEKYAVHWSAYPICPDDEPAWAGGELVRSLPPASYLVEIDVDGYVKWEHRDVVVGPGGRTDLGEIVLDPGLPLSGRVVDPDGRGVPHVDVFVDDAISDTDANGNFRWSHLAAGEHEVKVLFEADFLDARVPVTLANDTPPVVVTLHRGALLHVRVAGAAAKDGEVMNVQAFAADAPVGEEADGGVSLEGSLADGYVHRLPAGPHRIEVRRENDVLATKHVDLREGEDVEIEIALPK